MLYKSIKNQFGHGNKECKHCLALGSPTVTLVRHKQSHAANLTEQHSKLNGKQEKLILCKFCLVLAGPSHQHVRLLLYRQHFLILLSFFYAPFVLVTSVVLTRLSGAMPATAGSASKPRPVPDLSWASVPLSLLSWTPLWDLLCHAVKMFRV